jgi:hypothetical protein
MLTKQYIKNDYVARVMLYLTKDSYGYILIMIDINKKADKFIKTKQKHAKI